jgi:hypothetical protein
MKSARRGGGHTVKTATLSAVNSGDISTNLTVIIVTAIICTTVVSVAFMEKWKTKPKIL